jgi:hypothetical protein
MNSLKNFRYRTEFQFPSRLKIAVLFGLLPFFTAYSQIAVGDWRDHLPYNDGKCLAEAGSKIYCATGSGGLFSVDTRDNSLAKLSKVTGLSDADITTVGFSEQQQMLVIGYSNGNIDLIRNDSIINIPDIKRKSIMGDKALNRIFFRDHYAYLACGFGIVVCDLMKKEIRDTYLFGEGGTQIKVNDIVTDGQTLFAATEKGIYSADLNSPNLVDYNAWAKMEALPDPEVEYRFLAWYTGKLVTLFHEPVSGSETIISVSGGDWQNLPVPVDGSFGFLGGQNGNLLVCSDNHILIYGTNGELVRDVGGYYPKFALLDSGNGLWYADPFSGLVRINPTGSGTVFCPVGPAFRSAGDMEAKNGTVWVGGGTEGTKWKSYGAYSFTDEKWTNYNNLTIPQLDGFLNISHLAIDPANPGHVFGGSTGYGVVEFNNGSLTGISDETNTVLRPVTGFGHGYVLVTGMTIDDEGNLFVSTNFSDQPVYLRKTTGEWETVDLAYTGFGIETRIGAVLATSSGQVWLLIQNDGILVFNADREAAGERFFAVRNQIPELLDRVYSITEDLEGNIWVGTNKGPVVYYNPGDVFEESGMQGYQPEIPRNDGTIYVDLLLSTEKINDIAVDGGNRKWIATEKSGVFLVSDDGKKEIRHFTEENSPLFSNNVLTLAVNDLTGEVFFGTDKGIVSYRGEATEATDDFGKVYVFPNPVREDFEGDITVTGLARDANVKFTDISGNLVYETTALGGQAVWDGRNFRGERVHTGVYLVFCTNRDGSRTRVTKLLFIH